MNSKRVEATRANSADIAEKFATGEWTKEDHTSAIFQTESGLFQVWGPAEKITKLDGRVELVLRNEKTLDKMVRSAIITEVCADTETGIAPVILSESIIEALTPEAVAMGLDYSEIINGIRERAVDIIRKTECGVVPALSAVIQQIIRNV